MINTGKFHILLVEDNPADVRLVQEGLKGSNVPCDIEAVMDGEAAIHYLESCRPETCPDLIILDLNLPKRSGHDVLAAVKRDPKTRAIPVVIMSSSAAPADVQRAYEFHANCYVRKPGSLDDLFHVVMAIEQFWFNTAKLPSLRHAI